jgi:sec-independent protein translocase protein TatA
MTRYRRRIGLALPLSTHRRLVVFAEILGPDLLVIVVVIGLLFGSSQIPKLARSLGSAKREFEQGLASAHDESADTK